MEEHAMHGFQPSHMPCAECGASVPRAGADAHVCDVERLADYTLFQLRDEVAALWGEIAAWLLSPAGRFEAWCAERDRLDGLRPA